VRVPVRKPRNESAGQKSQSMGPLVEEFLDDIKNERSCLMGNGPRIREMRKNQIEEGRGLRCLQRLKYVRQRWNELAVEWVAKCWEGRRRLTERMPSQNMNGTHCWEHKQMPRDPLAAMRESPSESADVH
jgi:hypothetical protein